MVAFRVLRLVGGPYVSHPFFFADDSVIFGDAIPNRASKIRCILNAYDRVGFREKNNLNKSVVVFNKNTTPEAREVVTNILSVTGGEA